MSEGLFKLIWIVPVFVLSVIRIFKDMARDVYHWFKNKVLHQE